ncbi:hypothetical protein A9K55_004509 [Cordyceps militaris]|uniref:Uncharacterized protein n=1 Tax=Cordyceps militaris TaxID=73501 RepID=A0A2H4SM26_CORMI|nr:hypothetical protein A9K55_004509 [Cordyceps militaris]
MATGLVAPEAPLGLGICGLSVALGRGKRLLRVAGVEPLKGDLIGATRQQLVSIVIINPFSLIVKRVVAIRLLIAAGLVAPKAPLGLVYYSFK